MWPPPNFLQVWADPIRRRLGPKTWNLKLRFWARTFSRDRYSIEPPGSLPDQSNMNKISLATTIWQGPKLQSLAKFGPQIPAKGTSRKTLLGRLAAVLGPPERSQLASSRVPFFPKKIFGFMRRGRIWPPGASAAISNIFDFRPFFGDFWRFSAIFGPRRRLWTRVATRQGVLRQSVTHDESLPGPSRSRAILQLLANFGPRRAPPAADFGRP